MSAPSALRRHSTSLALITAAVGIGAYAYFVDRGTVTDNERHRRDNDVIPAFRREDVDRIEVSRPGHAPLLLSRALLTDGGDASWTMASPHKTGADQAAVERMLGAFEFASIVRKVDPRDAVGMDAPRATGALGMGQLVYRFALGAPSPVPEGSAYFRVDGEGTFVVTRELVDALLEDDAVLRDKTIVPYLSLELAGLSVRSKSGTVALTRLDMTSFALPSGLRASRDRMDRIWSALAEMRAESFLSDEVASQAVVAPSFAVRLDPMDKDRPAGVLAVGGPCPNHADDLVVVRSSPTRLSACAPKGIADGLGTTETDLVDDRLFAAHADEIEELRVEGMGKDGRRVELARKGAGWHERAPRDRELTGEEALAASAWAEAIAHANGTDVTKVRPGNRTALTAGVARVTVTKAEAGDESVVVGPREGADVSVYRMADAATLRVPLATARWLIPSELAVRSHILFDPKMAERVPSSIDTRCDGVDQLVTHDGTAWSMTARGPFPETLTPDVAGTLDLAAEIGRARADAWVADADDGTFGLEDATCRVALDYEGDAGATKVALTFGKDAPGGVYVMVAGDPAVFVAPKSLRKAVGRWLVDRSPFRVDPASLASVVLTKGGKSTVLLGKDLALGAADGGEGDRGAKAADALASLRADGVLHIGPAGKDEGFGAPVLELSARTAGDAGRALRFVVGHATVWDDERVYLARVSGIDATFAIAAARLAPLLDAL